MNFSSVNLFHGLQFFPVWVSHRVTSPAIKPAPVWALLFMGPQVLPDSATAQASCGVTAWDPPWPAGGYLLHCGLEGDSCLTMALAMGCRVTLPRKPTFLAGNSGKSKEEKIRGAGAAGWCSSR